MMLTYLGLMASSLLVWSMPAGAEQDGAHTLLTLQMLAFCIYGLGRGVVFCIRERAIIRDVIHDMFHGI